MCSQLFGHFLKIFKIFWIEQIKFKLDYIHKLFEKKNY